MNLNQLWGGFLKFIIEKIGAERIGRRKNYTLSDVRKLQNTVTKPGHFKAEPYYIENREKQIKRVINNTYEVWKRFRSIEDLK